MTLERSAIAIADAVVRGFGAIASRARRKHIGPRTGILMKTMLRAAISMLSFNH